MSHLTSTPTTVTDRNTDSVHSSPCSGLLFVLVGPSGVGKNTIMGSLLAVIPGLRQMPTATTRPIRVGETHGIQHYFMDEDKFRAMITSDALLEYQEVDPGRFYGTPRNPITRDLLQDGRLLIADIDIHGADALKRAFPDHVVLIFIEPPSIEALEARIRGRGGVDEAEIQIRLERAKREMPYAAKCDYRVVNIDLEQATAAVIALANSVAHERGCV